MDEIVKQAMARWPNVPHCYGWLALDARGVWRMRDERAQALKLPGDKIAHATLLGFINRNYQHDAQGRWYFQNGPQRVYINLEATPYVAHNTPDQGFVLHTGTPLDDVERAWMTKEGRLILQTGEILAQVDDRDMAACLALLRLDGKHIDDEQLLEWLNLQDKTAGEAVGEAAGVLTMRLNAPYHRQIDVQHAELPELAQRFNFVSAPQAD
ncbi:DUF2946 family protein [Undibacterium terreum]|uniref:DUF2946 family protein n=1 Tax=Undibacterium terreum TaxID=1224302 RepID=A0A916UR86_9BURK|nr:DUF2946 family protein [Undibacterium terreum]GGC83932.1 hypothetical protein GCM10011396_34140 [Undibacterium terreum]